MIETERWEESKLQEKILVVDDEVEIADLTALYLKNEEYQVTVCYTAADARKAIAQGPFDLAVLDVMLPEEDGFSLLRRIRQKYNYPVIMLTAKVEETDKINGLSLGADDYVTKPFDTKEVMARIKAVLRRMDHSSKADEVKEVRYDKLVVNMTRYELKVDGKVVDTPPKELELLFHLASHPNRVYTRDQLLDEVWGFEYYGDSRTIDVHVKRLREKLEGVSDQWSLETVWGVGYKFEVNE